MILFGFLFSVILCLVQGEGEFIVVRSPQSIKFQPIDDPIDLHLVPEVFSAAFGFTTQGDSDWQGLTISDPFNFAEAVVVLYVDGVPSLGKFDNVHKYPLETNEDEMVVWKIIKNRVIDRFPTENNTLVRLDLGYGEENIDDIQTKHLDKNIEEDVLFLQELQDLDTFMKKSEKIDGVPDLYWFVLKGIHAIADLRGAHHPATLEAKEKVHEILLKLGKRYSSLYHKRALVVAIVSDSSHTRRTRQAEEREGTNTTDSDLNLATKYHPAFPAIFNIILWFAIAFILSLIAISVFIASMDPGRDSIIYRMTSNRMKKDS